MAKFGTISKTYFKLAIDIFNFLVLIFKASGIVHVFSLVHILCHTKDMTAKLDILWLSKRHPTVTLTYFQHSSAIADVHLNVPNACNFIQSFQMYSNCIDKWIRLQVLNVYVSLLFYLLLFFNCWIQRNNNWRYPICSLKNMN